MMKALLDGVDITAQFSAADSNGVRQAQVDRPALNLGLNQIQTFDGTLRANASFTVLLNGAGAGSPAGLPLMVPIQTRVLTGDGTHATDYNIALYLDASNPSNATLYQATTPSDGSTAGFQLLWLQRTDLGLVLNETLPNPVPAGDFGWPNNPIYRALSGPPPAGCGTAGCLLIMQSLVTLGYTPCSVSGYGDDCNELSQFYEGMGASARWLFANGARPEVAYSFIGNTIAAGASKSPAPAGTYFERLTCSGANSVDFPRFCDSLGPYTIFGPNQAGFPNTSNTAPSNATPAQIGNISGALIRDNFYNYTYTQTAPAVAFSSATDSTANFTFHSFTINGNVYSSGFNNSSVGGFHVVILKPISPFQPPVSLHSVLNLLSSRGAVWVCSPRDRTDPNHHLHSTGPTQMSLAPKSRPRSCRRRDQAWVLRPARCAPMAMLPRGPQT